jgi:hypothetical protein
VQDGVTFGATYLLGLLTHVVSYYKPGTELISELFCYSYCNGQFEFVVINIKSEATSMLWVRTQILLDWFARCYHSTRGNSGQGCNDSCRCACHGPEVAIVCA